MYFTDDVNFVVVGQKLCSSLPLQNSLRVLTTWFVVSLCSGHVQMVLIADVYANTVLTKKHKANKKLSYCYHV